MKKQFILIPIIVTIAAIVGWKILSAKPTAAKAEGAEHAEHGAGHDEEHEKEGHVELSTEALKNAKLKIEEAGPAKIKSLLPLYGKIAANEEALAHVQPRFPGIVKEVRKRLGDQVGKGETLAVIESNESLRTYEVQAGIAGTIIAKDVTIGELAKDDRTLFTVADLSTVWVNLSVFRKDFGLLKVGEEVVIRDAAGTINAKLDYISPFGAETSQTALARCVIPNPEGRMRPGLFVTAEIATAEVEAPVAVRVSALQTREEKPVVFVQEGDAFEAREVELGTRDSEFVEVLSGLLPGDKYVSENSFILKAELGKGEAAHEH